MKILAPAPRKATEAVGKSILNFMISIEFVKGCTDAPARTDGENVGALDYCPRPRMPRASTDEAASLFASLTKRTARATNSAFDLARRPLA